MASRCQINGLGDGAVAGNGGHRSEHLGGVDQRGEPVRGPQQCRREEGAASRVDSLEVTGVDDRIGDRRQRAQRPRHRVAPDRVDQGSHVRRVRGADDDLSQRPAERVHSGIDVLVGDEGTSNGCALLSGLYSHLLDDLAHEEVELGSVRTGAGSEDGSVDRIGLHGEPGRPLSDGRVRSKPRRGRRRACECHAVAAVEMVEEVPRLTADQLQRALRQEVALDHDADRGLGHERRLRCRLDDRRDSRQERRGELLEHAPDREIERVDLDLDAGPWGEHVDAHERSISAEVLDLPIHDEVGVGKFSARSARVGQQDRGTAVDVEPRVRTRRPCPCREGIHDVPAGVVEKQLPQGAEDRGSLMERPSPQCCSADLAAVRDRRAKVDAGRRQRADGLTRCGVDERLAYVGRQVPEAPDEALQLAHRLLHTTYITQSRGQSIPSYVSYRCPEEGRDVVAGRSALSPKEVQG